MDKACHVTFWNYPKGFSLTSPPPTTPTPSEHLQQLTLTHMPHYAENWREAPLHTNLHMKTKVSLRKLLIE